MKLATFAAPGGAQMIGAVEGDRVREITGHRDMLALIEAAGIPAIRDMRLYTMPGDRMGLDPKLTSTPYAVVAPTSRWPGKRWSADRFAQLCALLLPFPLPEGVAGGGCLLVFSFSSLSLLSLVGQASRLPPRPPTPSPVFQPSTKPSSRRLGERLRREIRGPRRKVPGCRQMRR